MINLPGQKEGKMIKGPISQIDVVPTILDYMNQPIPKELQGESLRPYLDGKESKSNNSVFIEWTGYDTGIIGDKKEDLFIPDVIKDEMSLEELDATVSDPVRTVISPDGWKLIYRKSGKHELYNLAENPHETKNLFSLPENTEIINKLISQIKVWKK